MSNIDNQAIKCPVCGSENTRVLVDVLVSIDTKDIGKLNKAVIASKSTRILSPLWTHAKLVCHNKSCSRLTDLNLEMNPKR